MVLRYYFFLLACCLICGSGQVFAQKFEWLVNTKANNTEVFNDFVLSKDGFIYVTGRFDTTIIFNNERTISGNSSTISFVAKYTQQGQMIWVRPFTNGEFSQIVSDSNNKLIIYGYTRTTLTTELGSLSSNSQLLPNNRKHFLLNLDTASNVTKLKDIGLIGQNGIWDMFIDSDNELVLSGFSSVDVNSVPAIIAGVPINQIGKSGTGFIAKFDNQLNIKWITTVADATLRDIIFGSNNEIYSIGVASDTSWFGTKQIFPKNNQTGFVCKLNKNGSFIWVELFNGIDKQAASRVECITLCNDNLYIGGDYNKTFSYKIYQPPFYNSTQGSSRGYVLMLDTAGNYIKSLLINNYSGPSYSVVSNLFANTNGDIIASGNYSNNISISNLSITSFLSTSNTFMFSSDEKLAVSWLFSIQNTSASNKISSNLNRDAYILGTQYGNVIKFGDIIRTFPIQSNNGFLVKIKDISLRKDSLLEPAPYCAGDSISIRYSKRGTYNLGNTFYAQLSNRFGNYDSNTIIIGSRLDTASGIIRCKLPDSLRTSALYQMRLFSDSPAVNSFPDTTAYLIYAQPKADAGTDTLLCRGQAAFIPNTSKADTFSWSPANLLIDARKKEVQSLPLNNRTSFVLKATIGVCSKYDTVNVTYRSRLRINASDDSTICDNDTITLESFRAGGDSLGYSVQWFEIGPNANWQLRAVDTNTYTVFNLPPGAPSQFSAVLTDGCTVIPDTAFVSVTTRDPLVFNLPITQAICEGLSTSLQVQATGGIDAEYKFIWRNATGTVLADSTILEINPATIADTLFIIQLTDGCSAPIADTISLTVSNKPNASFSVDTTQGCQPLTVQFLYTGSQSAVNIFNWQFSDGQTSTMQNPQMVFPNIGVYGASLIVDNGCLDTIIQDSFITVFEQSQAAFTATPLEAELPNAVITFENKSLNSISYKWLLPNDQFDTVFEPELILKDTGLYQFVLIAKSKDGCLDTASQQVRVIEVFKLEIPNVFTPNGDGKNDTWNFEGTGYTVNEITLFNRWGTIVYNNNKPQVSWDGKDNNGKEITAGTYFYTLRLVTIDGITKELKGTVAVMR